MAVPQSCFSVDSVVCWAAPGPNNMKEIPLDPESGQHGQRGPRRALKMRWIADAVSGLKLLYLRRSVSCSGRFARGGLTTRTLPVADKG